MKDTTLMHYGIKNQKWGVRRFQNPDGTLTPAGKERYDDSPNDRDPSDPANMTYFSKKPSATASKPVSEMSTRELNKALDRLEKERKYEEYTVSPPSIISAVTKRVIATSSEKVATAYVTQYAERGLKAMTESAIGAAKEHGAGPAKKAVKKLFTSLKSELV